MQSLILNEILLRHHLPEGPCPQCGRSSPYWELHHPFVTPKRGFVLLVYPAYCQACRFHTRIRIAMPLLEFGFRLARDAIRTAEKRAGRSRQRLILWRFDHDLDSGTRQAYKAFLAEVSIFSRAEVCDDEQELLGMSDEEWEAFKRRADLGVDDNDGQQ